MAAFLLILLPLVVMSFASYFLGVREGRRRAVQDTMRIIRRQTLGRKYE